MTLTSSRDGIDGHDAEMLGRLTKAYNGLDAILINAGFAMDPPARRRQGQNLESMWPPKGGRS